ncbi:sigma-70 family RNA polymerase sigma factor [Aeoliella mucimassa]|uniref:ECF RNA polymerase sigma factor SigE n=1 Tax=Aeoliella mucimassa TaxID=2527972 RepID=A0A518AUS9_9BACT|nr:sigma-70 family RNA polymerase sigma factor [Aeoliella mucimassa]QDU58474.1 ECF RNA polymerase sigma factor SigE [Aeoliella mucimassa]
MSTSTIPTSADVDQQVVAPTPRVPTTDGELLLRFTRHSDQEAFARLVNRHAALVWSGCRQVLKHREDIEDAFQATFLILAKRASDIRACDSAAGWLYRVAHRTSLSLLRKKRSTREQPLAEPDTLDGECDPLEQLHRQYAIGVLTEELQALPRRYREPLVLCYLEGRSRSGAADELDVTTATVKGRLTRGRRMLRQRLARRGIALSMAVGFASAAVRGAEAVAASPLTASTTLAASDFVSNTAGGPSTAGSTVQSLAQHGVSAMYYASLAKPVLCFLALAAVGVGVALAAEPANSPALSPNNTTGVALVVTTDGEGEEPATASISLSAPSSATEDVAADEAVEVESDATIEVQVSRDQKTGTITATAGNQATPVTPSQHAVVIDTRSITTGAPATAGSFAWAQNPMEGVPTAEEFDLQRKYWETRAEGLKQKSHAIVKQYDRIQTLIEQGVADQATLDKSNELLSEAILVKAEVYQAQAKVLEMERLKKQAQQVSAAPTPAFLPAATDSSVPFSPPALRGGQNYSASTSQIPTAPPAPPTGHNYTAPAAPGPSSFSPPTAANIVVSGRSLPSLPPAPMVWFQDAEGAVKTARENGRVAVLNFVSPQYAPSQEFLKMLRETPKVTAYLQGNAVPAVIDIEQHPEIVREFKVTGMPSVCVVGPNGAVLESFKAPQQPKNYLKKLQTWVQIVEGQPSNTAAEPHPPTAVWESSPVPATAQQPPADAREVQALQSELESLRQQLKELKQQLQDSESEN